MKVSLISPVYNEADRIGEFITRSSKALSQITNDFEIVLVNDSSTDDTLATIKKLLPDNPRVKLVHLNKNSGQHIATAIGLKKAAGDLIFMMDSDLQVNPDYMIEFYEFAKKQPDWDIISALRISRSKGLMRSVGSKIVSVLLQKLTMSKLKDIGSTFKLINREALNKLLSHDILIQNMPILMMNLNLSILEYPIKYNNVSGSNYGFKDLFTALLLAFLNFSTGHNTLVFLIFMGGILSALGVFVVCFIIIWGMINQNELPTNYLIFFLFIFLIGLQFILMGILAYKVERLNKNLDFRRNMEQRAEYVD
ncbi:MAG: hypothetical protein COA57_01045 [Flavobacteriales bacterium]|nr:MAG: hypothetical protein COA57_01045 [Flavobacteriales bacterium]